MQININVAGTPATFIPVPTLAGFDDAVTNALGSPLSGIDTMSAKDACEFAAQGIVRTMLLTSEVGPQAENVRIFLAAIASACRQHTDGTVSIAS